MQLSLRAQGTYVNAHTLTAVLPGGWVALIKQSDVTYKMIKEKVIVTQTINRQTHRDINNKIKTIIK